jgi:cell division septation protein DedD
MKYVRRLAGAIAIVAAAVLTLSAAAETADRTVVANAQASNVPGDPGWP